MTGESLSTAWNCSNITIQAYCKTLNNLFLPKVTVCVIAAYLPKGFLQTHLKFHHQMLSEYSSVAGPTMYIYLFQKSRFN